MPLKLQKKRGGVWEKSSETEEFRHFSLDW